MRLGMQAEAPHADQPPLYRLDLPVHQVELTQHQPGVPKHDVTGRGRDDAARGSTVSWYLART
ncbi:hypothetical protein JMJ55_23135 [Belnapia sp. T6]|uniref:Uncharacterized protein n=1 Tax=Belnapia mucosa TaxID=2804532 RepID=A0ABS1V988_9PROT|nr:hypothetical protein [Belnapia mucosa]MBL6458236.1 hypothetical protein [Belnapia mucosa]